MSPAVEVYNCAVGSPDCSQCLGREDLGHLCVWSDGCRPRGTMQPLPGTCPAPEIRAVSTPPPLPPPLEPVTPTHLTVRTHSAPHGLWDPQLRCLHVPRPPRTASPTEHPLGASSPLPPHPRAGDIAVNTHVPIFMELTVPLGLGDNDEKGGDLHREDGEGCGQAGHEGGVRVWDRREAGVECLYSEVSVPLLIRGKLG